MHYRPDFLLLAFTCLTSVAAFAQCSAVEFDSRSLTASDPSYVEGVALLSPGSFVGVQIAQAPPITLLQVLPHIERQLINCYQKSALGTTAPAYKDYSAGAGSMPVNIGRLNSGWTFGAISLGFGDNPIVEVVAANAPLQITTQTGYSLPGEAITGLFVDLNKDGFADLVIVSSDETTGAGFVSILLGKGDGTFESPVNYPAGSDALSVAAGDFNGDGNLDLVVAGQTANVFLLTGTGTGTFNSAIPVVSLPANIFPTSVTVADINNDGHLDMVLTAVSGVYILLGNGSGSFTLGPLIPLASSANYAAVGDFNMDGKPDLAIASQLTGTVSILIGNGAGQFASPVAYLGPTSTSYLVVTDVNGDGKPDIAVAQGTPSLFAADDGSGNIATLIGNGDGTFQGSLFYSAGSDGTAMAVADVNGDGKPDLVVTDSVTSFGGSANQVITTFQTFLNQGNGTFGAPLPGTSTTLGTNVTAADFNGDGKIDLAIAGANVSVLFGKGDGTFLTGVEIPGVASAGIVVAGDFNGDHKPDLIVGSSTTGFLPGPAGVAISLNTGNGTFAPPANLGGSTPIAIRSGTFNAGLTNPEAIVAADFNHDGKLDFAVADGGAAFDATQPGGLIVFLGNGNGTFQNATELPVGVNPTNIAVGDLNGDGILDIAVSTGGSLAATPSGYELGVLIGNGDGTFKPAVFYPVDFGPAGLGIADLNADGKPDVALTHCCGDLSPTYLLGNGDGTLQAEAGFKAGASPFGVVAADFNNDGKPDLALIGSYGVGVLLNHSPAAGLTSVSAAGFVDVPLTPNSIVSGFGANLATGSQPGATIPLPTQLAGASFSIKDSTGTITPAGLFFASPLQVNYLVPGNIAIGPAQLSAASPGGTLTESLQIVPFAPSLFLLYSGNLVAGYLTRVTNGAASLEQVYETSGSGLAPRPIPLPTGSDQLVLTVFGTGLRDYQGTFYAIVGNQFAPVLYAGDQGSFLGLDQVNIQLSSALPSGTLPIAVGTFTGGFSNTASILIQ